MARTTSWRMKNFVYFASLFLILVIYLVLRLGWRDTIEFGYDQPRLASRVLEYLKDGNILNTQKYAERSPWGNISWGPSLFLFFAPFLLISTHPITVSVLVACFNILSVVTVVFIGWRYFSPTAGLVAGLLMATHPWWVIFSRMIYQPTPVPTLIALGILMILMIVEEDKVNWTIPLVLLWGILIQIYFHSISFVFVSASFMVIKFQKRFLKKILLGLVLSSLIFIPYWRNFNLSDYLPKTNINNQLISGRDGVLSRLKNLSPNFVGVVSGGNFSWQLGYSYGDFLSQNPKIDITMIVIFYLTLLMLSYNLLKAIISTKYRWIRSLLLSLTIAPVFFLALVRIPSVPPIPRYFLISIPSLVLLWGLVFDEIRDNKKSIAVIILSIIPIWWIVFVVKYYNFVINYSYHSGPLSTYSDIPYSFLKRSLDFIYLDSKAQNYKQIVISNDASNPTSYALNWATAYSLNYVFQEKLKVDPNQSTGNYLIDYSSDDKHSKFLRIYRSGPYTVYRVSSL